MLKSQGKDFEKPILKDGGPLNLSHPAHAF
jgi:hypothetical protein